MHIRQVLVKAELEKFQQYKDVYNAMKKGKVPRLLAKGPRRPCGVDANVVLVFVSCSFVSVAEPKGFLFSLGPTSASFAKSKLFLIIIQMFTIN